MLNKLIQSDRLWSIHGDQLAMMRCLGDVHDGRAQLLCCCWTNAGKIVVAGLHGKIFIVNVNLVKLWKNPP